MTSIIRHPSVGRLRFALKWTVAHALYVSGVLHLWKRLVFRNRAVVLTYHRVLADDDCARTWSHPAIVVRNRTFERHVEMLSREFHMLSLAEFESFIEGQRPLPRPSCLLTFDDGWRDTYTEAWPILRRHSVPVLVFISVGFIGTPTTLWQEHLRAVLFRAYQACLTDAPLAARVRPVLARHGYGHVMDAPADSVRATIMDAVLSHKYDDADRALAPIRELEPILAATTPPDAGPDGFMSWEMVKAMADEGAEFGGHGVTHRLLTTLSQAEVLAELGGSRDQIRAHLGRNPRSVAYPDGKWNALVSACLERTGYALAFSTEGGRVSPGDARQAIRRVNIHEAGTSSRALLMAQIVGLF